MAKFIGLFPDAGFKDGAVLKVTIEATYLIVKYCALLHNSLDNYALMQHNIFNNL